MSKLYINGGKCLKGNIMISGSKNAALPILTACILTDEQCVINNVPCLSDTNNMLELLKASGAVIDFNGNCVKLKCENINPCAKTGELAGKLRASFLMFGPLLAKNGRAKIYLPGGCRIGTRPVDLHIKGLIQMGAAINKQNGFVEGKCKRLKGTTVYLDFPSVGATENLIMAATLADGDTVIENAAAEPEITDLADFINNMGGKVTGAGTDTVRISGVTELHGCTHSVIPDRIEAGTFMTAAAITGGSVKLCNVCPEHLKPVIAKIKEFGVDVTEFASELSVSGNARLKAADIKTMPYPGFPTDMQAPFSSVMAVAKGTSVLTETVFENRFMHLAELQRMGADIKTEGRTAIIEGTTLTAAKVSATDLRAGAALAVAALAAKGTTEIDNYSYIERGYENFVEKMNLLGADITKIT